MQADLERMLFDEPAIHRRLDEIAAQISKDYRDRELTVIAVLNGSLIFIADLLRRIPLPLKLDCLSVASYHGKAKTSQEVIFKQIGLPDVADRNILLLDDILDSGRTLAAIREKLKTANPRSIRICVLLSKKKERSRQVDADYVGFEVEDEFVVGYGLDFMEQYRNLPYIGVLRRELILNSPDPTPMNIRVQFYSHLRDLAGGSELSIDLPDKATVGDLLTKIYEKVPTLRSRDKSILIGVGVEFVDRNYELKPGEEISIMPPVQGG